MDPAAIPAASVETEDTNMTEGGGAGPAAANTDTNTNANTSGSGSGNGGGKQQQQVQQFENTTLSNLKLEPASSPAPFLDDYTNNSNAAPGAPHSSRNSNNGTPQPSQPTAATMPPKRKKKGTATTVKATKKGGPSRAKSKKGGAKKGGATAKKTPAAGKTAATGVDNEGNENEDEDAGSDSDDDESDHGPYCLCRGPDDHRWMISCEACEDWFHGECVDVSKDVGETLIQSYICPRCTVPGKLVTRYKKTCGLGGCSQPARISAPTVKPGAPNSAFCSQDHCNVWWEQLVATLPRKEGDKGRVGLTQAEFMGLLATKGGAGKTAPAEAAAAGNGWFVGQKPFAVPADFWSQHEPKEILTAEEAELLATSSASRRALADEVVLCRKMLQLLEMAVAQRLEAVAAGRLKKDGGCGYDTALDHVGALAQFAAFVTSPAGQAIFTANKLESTAYDGEEAGGGGANTTTLGPWTNPGEVERTYMCERHRCKPHYNWHASHARHVHFLLKELAAEAKLKLDNENRVRDNAAVRYFRKRAEASTVISFDDESDEDGDVTMDM
ncbi:hypothetical protein MCOR27_009151 [Pyricularia oryzae]|uniref:PHD-type domain-containing protein n=2 Tax=Pyricularia TaxID=48558 RepID=A0ABQ8P0A6_PYRGI|nr:hypothetical protein MCOR01_010003 [Pyricularia oryzae]KAI6304724.1 hypothetical protein MCOR33_000243 [Pyricularia grisea]KAH9436681.1 hypothetical protein MCOR02_000350 [Pyricularia oryzae]KAI6259005.1 hypothetical protein MCOR19_004657 [Pyricularia oryzae]KAI6270749.1 hypothetical protein MCOR27_009151 [Pyricularia oryzae]